MKQVFLSGLFFIMGLGSLYSQEQQAGRREIWSASVPGGEYMVAVNRMSSVSKHSYLLDGVVKVTEVTVDTDGNSLVRFYVIDKPSVVDSLPGADSVKRASEILTGKVPAAADINAVQKTYPGTTHSKTIEYRLSSIDQLNELFSSAKRAFTSGRGGEFSPN